MNIYFQNTENLWIQPIHTNIKGRARYKVSGLLHSETLKRYLELRLSQEEIIVQANANYFTGNILVIFHPDFTFKDIAFFLQNIVLDYNKEVKKLPVNKILHSQRGGVFGLMELGVGLMEEVNNVISHTPQAVGGATSTTYKKMEFTTAFNKARTSTAKKKAKILSINKVDSKLLSNLSNYLSFKTLRASLSKYSTKRNIILVSGAVCTLVAVTRLLHIYGVDQAVLLAIQKLHTPLFDRIMLAITSLADPLTLLLICLGLEINWKYYNHQWEATTLSIATIGAIGFNYLLKVLFGRARPALWNHIIDVSHYSFPSGHAMGSIVIYGFIGYILAQQFPQWQQRISALSVVLILAIGLSRLYLGVHWPTDILAGYAIGLAWLIFCILSLKVVQKSDLLLDGVS